MIDDKLLQKIAACVPIFSGMPLACLLKTIACADHWPLRKGDLFFSEGDGGYSFFVLLTGEAEVVKFAEGEHVCLARLGAGDCFGEMALVNSQARSATVRAASDVLSLRFSKEKIDAYPEAAAFIYRNIAKVLARRLSDSNEVTAKLMLELTPPEADNKAPSDTGNRHTEFEG
jgi:CRP-like cAMP-binding protein